MNTDMKQEKMFTVLRAEKSSKLQRFVALNLWLSTMHLVILLSFLMLFILPWRWSFMVFVLLLTLMVIPLFETSAVAQNVARFICKHGSGHFPLTVVMEDKTALNPERAFLFAMEPHSVIPIGFVGLCNFTGFLPIRKLKGVASSTIFVTPFLRHLWSWLGLAPASKKVVLDILRNGDSCALVPGGVREMLYMQHDREVVYLKQRFGFIRIAMELGVPLVPCFAFGQTRVYKWWKPSGSAYNKLSRALGFAPLLFWGMWGTPIPFPRPLYVVIGEPIELKKNPQPTQEELLEVQGSFISAIQELYERHKMDAGYENIPLYVY